MARNTTTKKKKWHMGDQDNFYVVASCLRSFPQPLRRIVKGAVKEVSVSC